VLGERFVPTAGGVDRLNAVVLAYAVISTPASLLFYDGATLFGALFLPTVIDWKVWALLDAISAMAFGVVTIASVWIYRERAARAA
jgi:hypothetical protein